MTLQNLTRLHPIRWLSGVRISALLLLTLISSFSGADSLTEQQVESDSITDYMEAIDNSEGQFGAYATELSELYLGLGNALYAGEEYTEALNAFQKGMQIERVNYGLSSLSQSPYLFSIADTERYLGNWDKSQQALERVYTINSNNYGEVDVRMLGVLDKILEWYMDSYKDRRPKGGYANLVISERIAQRMYEILNKDMSLDDPEAPDRFRRLGYLQHVIAVHLKEHGEPSESGLSISMSGSSGRPNKATTSHLHFLRGKLALEKVIASVIQQPNSTETDQALAIAELGDWYLVFGQKAPATAAYQLALDVLETSEDPQQTREDLFGLPRMIEFSMTKSPPMAAGDQPTESQLELAMTISTYGVPNNIEVVNPPESLSKEALRDIRRDTRGKRFRPKLVNGLAEEAPYRMLYDQPIPKG
ncbi:MAG: tetratricopeptide (TPR) repeat protein [Porticoccaceae bacterium]|jgi:tetratricopeptide (TPR) repeat protein|tara:strand:+ start:149 stop:1405 length:1257 start_codon:yes stop_codon:yes gene_type:complete